MSALVGPATTSQNLGKKRLNFLLFHLKLLSAIGEQLELSCLTL